MPTTRSMTSLSSLSSKATMSSKLLEIKRKLHDVTDASELSSQDAKRLKALVPSGSDTRPSLGSGIGNELLPALLTFSFESAKQHLISVDPRFKAVFSKLPCRPFEQLENVDPFRTLTTSILGQQISWLAARSIKHRFIRLYDQSLPEKPPADGTNAAKMSEAFFPPASQVAATGIAMLKSAGLSTRKAEYVTDLASRFADGRLTNKKLVEADDEELARLLTEVRGIGRWTVDMFAIFSLRRPDILPVGDLGVQRGLIRWFLSLHSPTDPVTISPKKLPKTSVSVLEEKETSGTSNSIQQIKDNSPQTAEQTVFSLPPPPATPSKNKESIQQAASDSGMAVLPGPFTPSINRILNPGTQIGVDGTNGDGRPSRALPEGLTVTVLRSKLHGKKKIKGALLTPKEMEDLTECWRPYRSLGVYYMWALAEETTV